MLWIVLLAVTVRLGVMVYFHSYDIPPDRDHWAFGYETGRIARSLALGLGYSSPLPEPTGPTGAMPPIYPFLISVLFRIFGIYTTAAACSVYLLQVLFSALTCVLISHLGCRIYSARIGSLAALLFALYPPAVWHSVSTIWNTSLLTCGFTLIVVCVYALPAEPKPHEIALLGALMGALLLVDAAPGMTYPPIVVWLWRVKRLRLRELAIVIVGCSIVLLPWIARNAITMGQLAPRTVAGIALRLGNSEGAWKDATGGYDASLHPVDSREEFARYRQMGEIEYNRWSGQVAIGFIRDNPARFATMTGRRVLAWWFGQDARWIGHLQGLPERLDLFKRAIIIVPLPFLLIGALRSRRSDYPSGLLVTILLVYPIPYYFLFVVERYRFPTDPFMIVIATYGVVASFETFRARARTLKADVLTASREHISSIADAERRPKS